MQIQIKSTPRQRIHSSLTSARSTATRSTHVESMHPADEIKAILSQDKDFIRKVQIPRLEQLINSYVGELEKKCSDIHRSMDVVSPVKSPNKRESIKRILDGHRSKSMEYTPRRSLMRRAGSQESKKPLKNLADIQYINSLSEQQQLNTCPSLQKILGLQSEEDLFSIKDFNDWQNLIYEPLKFAKEYIIKTQQLLSQHRHILDFVSNYQSNWNLQETLQYIEKRLQIIFDCEATNIKFLDKELNLLWQKQAQSPYKEYNTIQGIDDHILKNGSTNIKEISQYNYEYQFNKKQYKSLLGHPMISNENTIGIIALGSANPFARSDEVLLCQITQFISNSLEQFSYEPRTINQQQVESLVQAALILQTAKDQRQLHSFSTIILQSYQIKQFVLYFQDVHGQLFTYVASKRKSIKPNCGIIGVAHSTQKVIQTDSCYRDHNFCNIADIETHLPVITIPLKYNKSQGVLQYVDIMGINNIVHKNVQYKPTNFEQIQTLSNMIIQINAKFMI